MNSSERIERYKELGYTVLENVFSEELMDSWRSRYDDMVSRATPPGSAAPKAWLSSTFELEPTLMLPAINNPEILDFVERIIGPLAQLDNLTFMAFPSVDRAEAEGRATLWHRDRFGRVPRGSDYVSPWSCNAITYLQDLTDEYGPLRIVPGSHRMPLTVASEDKHTPRSDELLLKVKAGDVVITHANLLHSGTPNTSGQPRYFLSVHYTRVGLRTLDNHNGPAAQMVLKWAKERQDRRVMRLFGEDPLFETRANAHFTVDEDTMWDNWIKEDRAALLYS